MSHAPGAAPPTSHRSQPTPAPAAALCFASATAALGSFRLQTGALQIPPGQVTVVLGPNGCGKSTVLRLAAGLLSPTAGAVTLDGRAIHALAEPQRAARVAYVPQRSTVGAPFTVAQVVALGRHALPPNPARIQAALELVRLDHRSSEPFHHLSAGQQQRVALARALAQHEPGGIILLDEVLSAVDLPETLHLVRVLRELAERSATILLATHDLALARAVGHTAWYLQHGQTAAWGPAADILTPARLAALVGVPVVGAEGSRARLPVADLSAMLHHEP